MTFLTVACLQYLFSLLGIQLGLYVFLLFMCYSLSLPVCNIVTVLYVWLIKYELYTVNVVLVVLH